MGKKKKLVGRVLRATRLHLMAFPLAFSAVALGADPAPPQPVLPEPSALSTPAEAYADPSKPSITIIVTKTGQQWLEKRYIAQGASQQQTVRVADLQADALEKSLAALADGDRDMQIYILADRDARFQSYVDVLKVLRKLNFSRISIIAVNARKQEK